MSGAISSSFQTSIEKGSSLSWKVASWPATCQDVTCSVIDGKEHQDSAYRV
jgi:hypothetical protein